MGVNNVLGVGISGLKAFQRTLSTVGQNISNANTEGYSRQKVELTARDAQPTGVGFLGNGVKIETTERMFDQNLINQVRSRTSIKEFFSSYKAFSSQIDDVVADADASLPPAIESFFAGVQEISNDPTSIAARRVMITEAENLVSRFKTLDSWFTDLNTAVNKRVITQVATVNEIASSVANLNQEIMVARALSGGHTPNDLQDKRDALIDKLSEHVNVSVVETDNGSLDVFIGTGQSLVLGSLAMRLEARRNPNDTSMYEVAYAPPNSSVLSSISKMLGGGDLGGVLSFREEILKPAQNGLGRIAVGLTSTFNALHKSGLDLKSKLGTDFFNEPVLGASSGVDNIGSSKITATLDDIQALTTDEYQLTFDGANYLLRNESTNEVTALTVSAAGPPIQFDPVFGMNITLDSEPAKNDTFYLRPVREATRQLDVLVTDPVKVAAANLMKTESSLSGNLGDATISEADVVDNSAANLQETVTITFTNSAGLSSPADADQFTVSGSVSGLISTGNVYTDAGVISVNGWEVKISGSPKVGDEFVVERNTTGISDNRNARMLADLQNMNTMINGNASYHDAYAEIVVLVGNRTSQSEISLEAQNALLIQAKGARDNVSGVNLDEEAANLLRFQQAYSAAAQVITTADEMFQTLLGAVRR
ncbi:MAG TPA: flagellar hook-associated protein FlgK [Gammaproteobacteria bacterium]|nr:flagellar hook-associated protein FlgK [Gammaproteobacteria bacterium]